MNTKHVSLPEPTRDETLGFLASMLVELSAMARSHRCSTLSYLLEIAELEAREQLGRSEQPIHIERDSDHTADAA